jgi:hypothetical protein
MIRRLLCWLGIHRMLEHMPHYCFRTGTLQAVSIRCAECLRDIHTIPIED